jgi:phage-related protein
LGTAFFNLDDMYQKRYIQSVIDKEKKLKAVFFCTSTGKEPVRDWLKGLEHGDRRIIGIDIKTVEFGWPVGMPTCRAMGSGLWEVRSNLSGGRIARVLFCMENDCMVLLHGFIKKSPKTPQQDLDLARRRKRQMEVA